MTRKHFKALAEALKEARYGLEEASAKYRTGMPNDEAEDKALPIWSGLIPLRTIREAPLADDSSLSLPLPAHLIPSDISI